MAELDVEPNRPTATRRDHAFHEIPRPDDHQGISLEGGPPLLDGRVRGALGISRQDQEQSPLGAALLDKRDRRTQGHLPTVPCAVKH